jgi:regulatory protein
MLYREGQRRSHVNDKEHTRAKNAAYRLLTYRPRSRAELEVKLRDKEFDDAIIEAVLAELARFGYVNDLKFAREWTRSRIRLQGFGRRRIGQELKNKGIGREIIGEVFAEVFSEETEIETAKRVVERRVNTMKSLDRETRKRRLAGFLERKGFSFEIIRNVLRDSDRG